jgi:hypothetical protein
VAAIPVVLNCPIIRRSTAHTQEVSVAEPVESRQAPQDGAGNRAVRSPLARLTAGVGPGEAARPRRALRVTAPKKPDARFVIGIVFLIVSAIAGARLLADSTSTVPVWTLTRDLPAGALLVSSDVTQVQVRDVGAAYVPGSEVVVGRRLVRDLGAGEFIPGSSLIKGQQTAATRLVTIAVDPLHMPADLRRGHRVDLWSTPEVESVLAAPLLVMSGLIVMDVPSQERSLASTVAVTVEVPVDQVQIVISAVRSGLIDLVRVPKP